MAALRELQTYAPMANAIIEETLDELCAARAITDPAIRAYLASKLSLFWQQGARSKQALTKIIRT